MKTVFNRALSLVMCLILICSTVSVMAFGANAAEDFDYKTYAQNATKENVHYLFDVVDDALADANGTEDKLRIEVELLKDLGWLEMQAVEFVLGLFVKSDALIVGSDNVKLLIDLSSVDAICKTVDNYRAVIALATNETLNKLINLGDLKNINLDVFDQNLSRGGSGDYKIFREVLELASANSGIVEKLLSGKLELGVIGDAAALDLSSLKIADTLKKAIVDAVFDEDDANYAAAKNRALTNFDEFVYIDLIGLLSKDGGILEGIKVSESTTVNALITDVFDIVIDKYVIGLVDGVTFSFADSLGEKYKALDEIIEIDGKYDFTGIAFTKDAPVIDQLNNVLGLVFKQIVPDYKNAEGEYLWENGSYDVIGANMRNLVKYIAKGSGLIENVDGKSDDVLMLEIIKIIFEAADTNGEKEVYEAIKNTKTLTEMVNTLLVHLSGKSYPAGTTYEQVLGDFIIEKIGQAVPLKDANGNDITAGSGKTVWDVLNSVLNFFLVDKNLNAYFGMNVKKSDSYFTKLDVILDFTADDGDANFKSKEYIDDLINSVFTVDLQSFVELTAVRASNYAGNVSVVKFLYNTVYNLLNNWADSSTALKKYSSNPFNNALSNDGIANIVKVFIETLSKRSEGAASLVGLIAHFITDISEKVESRDATCTSAGFRTTKTCLKCNKAYMQGATIAAKGHKYNSGVITKYPGCTSKGEKTYTCTVCGHRRVDQVAATGHKESGYKVTKAATYKTKGQKVNKCTVCNTTLGTQITNMLTLNKASGLKFQALSTTSVKFSWNAVAGAESYAFYYKTNTGKWKKVDAKNKTTVTVKKLKAGTTYKFKVEAIAGGNKSESNTVSATTKPAAVTLKALRSKKKKELIVEWKKVAGVTGYEVQYSTSKKFAKKATKTVTIKKQKTVKTIIKKLKSNKKYYARVRAYKTVNGTKVYSAYSKVKNINCK